jgi:hypothetical protein
MRKERKPAAQRPSLSPQAIVIKHVDNVDLVPAAREEVVLLEEIA